MATLSRALTTGSTSPSTDKPRSRRASRDSSPGGHGTAAADLSFSSDDSQLVSVGGNEGSVLIRRHCREDEQERRAARETALALRSGVLRSPKRLDPVSMSMKDAWETLDGGGAQPGPNLEVKDAATAGGGAARESDEVPAPMLQTPPSAGSRAQLAGPDAGAVGGAGDITPQGAAYLSGGGATDAGVRG